MNAPCTVFIFRSTLKRAIAGSPATSARVLPQCMQHIYSSCVTGAVRGPCQGSGVSRRPPTADTNVRFQDDHCGIRSGTSLVLPVSFHKDPTVHLLPHTQFRQMRATFTVTVAITGKNERTVPAVGTENIHNETYTH